MNKIFSLCLLVILVLISCNEKADVYLGNYTLIIKNEVFDINTNEDLLDAMKKVVTKENDNDIRIKEVALRKAKDLQGEYQYISAKYSLEDREVTTVGILEPMAGKNMYRYMCTMTCDPKGSCQGCKQTIITQCVSQTCVCDSGTGSCSSSISF